MAHDRDQQAQGVGDDVTLAALVFLAGVEAPNSAIPADGLASRPPVSRAATTR